MIDRKIIKKTIKAVSRDSIFTLKNIDPTNYHKYNSYGKYPIYYAIKKKVKNV